MLSVKGWSKDFHIDHTYKLEVNKYDPGASMPSPVVATLIEEYNKFYIWNIKMVSFIL